MQHIIGVIPKGNGHTSCLPKLAETQVKQLLRRKGEKASANRYFELPYLSSQQQYLQSTLHMHAWLTHSTICAEKVGDAQAC
jgi:hypothetical protein